MRLFISRVVVVVVRQLEYEIGRSQNVFVRFPSPVQVEISANISAGSEGDNNKSLEFHFDIKLILVLHFSLKWALNDFSTRLETKEERILCSPHFDLLVKPLKSIFGFGLKALEKTL